MNEKYGAEHVAQIGTYTTLSTKMVLKDIGRVLGIDHEEINELNKHIPSNQGKVMKLADALEEVPAVKSFALKYPELMEISLEAQGAPRSASAHACGYLISPTDLSSSVPLMRNKEGKPITCYEGGELEELGYIKSDMLKLKNLSVIRNATVFIKERHNIDIDIDTLSYKDKKVFSMIKKGDTIGLFQVEYSAKDWFLYLSN